MPHSSGGGFSGGGFHSGSSSSGHSYHSSSRPFPGAICYVYYDRKGRARTIYSNHPSPTSKKGPVGTFFVLGLLALLPAAIIAFAGNHNPVKLPTNYEHTFYIQDDLNVFSSEEEAKLKETFQQFFDLSGICPGLISVNTNTWKSHYSTLENFAYNAYLSKYKDESHWLLVYSAEDTIKTNWAFEGMQGDDTDQILTKRVTNNFNKTCYDALSGNVYTVAGAIDNALRGIMPNLMDYSFYVEPGIYVFSGIWEAGVIIAIVSTAFGAARFKHLKTAKRVEGDVTRKRCPHCGNEYIPGTIDRCPKCEAFLDDDHPKFAHFPKEGE